MKAFKNSISAENIATLKKIVEKRLGRAIVSHSDCLHLADDVLEKVDRRIGITTFRRFFNIDESKNLPSAYTLDTLCIYTGYKSWFDFVSNNMNETEEEQEIPELESLSWDKVKHKAENISKISLKGAKNKSGIRYDYTVDRNSIIKHIKNFLTTPFSATALVSPAGYGKTIGIVRAIEKMFFSDDSEYGDDIVWFVDASMILGLIGKGFDLSKWLASQIGLGYDDNYKEYFALHPDLRKGRMILIIDSVDRITERANKLREFFETIINLIALNDETPWFKIILSMRSSSWSKIMQMSKELPLIQSQWYNVGFYSHSQFFNNIPLLTNKEKSEIFLKVIKKSSIPEKVEKIRQQIITREYYEYFTLPVFIQIYLNKLAEDDLRFSTPVDLYKEYMKIVVSDGKYSYEKLRIIDGILEKTDFGFQGKNVKKKELIDSVDSRFADKAYDELLSVGVISEVNHYNKFGTRTTHVNIEFPFLLSYLIAVTAYNFFDEPNIKLYESFIEVFRTNERRMEILKWLVFLPFHFKNYDLIFDFRLFLLKLDKENEKYTVRDNDFINEIIVTIGICLRHDPEARENLIPRFAKDTLWQKYYFESFLDHDHVTSYYGDAIYSYMIYKRDIKGMLYAHILLLYRYTLLMDFERARFHLNIIDSIDPVDKMKNPYYFAMSVTFKTLYFLIFYNKIPDACFDMLIEFIDIIPPETGEYRKAIYLSAIVGVTNISERYDVTMNIWYKVHNEYSENNINNNIPELYLLMIFVAEAFIETGDFKKGFDLLKEFRIGNIDSKKQTFRIMYDMALGKYYYYTGDFKRSYDLLENNSYLASQLKLGLYQMRSERILSSLKRSIDVLDKTIK